MSTNVQAKAGVQFTEASERENIVSGENISTSFGKISKVITDLRDIAYADTLTINCNFNGPDGTPEGYLRSMKSYFASRNANTATPAELTQICEDWYTVTRDNWNGYTEFERTGVSTGTRGGSNAGLICTPSTDTVAGQDDYAGLPLFYPIDVNYEIDATTKDVVITGIDGITSSFERDNPDKFVGVMQMSAYVWYSENSVNNTFRNGYSAQYYDSADSCWALPEAMRFDGTFRQFVVHTKYMGSLVDNKLRSYSGGATAGYVISHNTVNTYGAANGSQYSGGSVTLLSFLQIMTRIKYASMTLDGIIQGCVDYNIQAPVAAATTDKQYVLLSAANAEKFLVGSTVLIGTATSTSAPDRGTASTYSVTGQAGAVITKITDDPDGSANKAVWFENLTAFSATGSGIYASGVTVLSTYAWRCGANDSVLGNDGSVYSASNGKSPAMIQRIEFATGLYEVYGDVIMQVNPATTEYPYGYYSYYVCKDASKRSTSITANYTLLPDVLPYLQSTSSAAWRYISDIKFSNGIAVPSSASGGSSTTFTKDAFYFSATPSGASTREWPSFGTLRYGSAAGGLSCVNGISALSYAAWGLGGRLSCAEGFRT